MLVADGLAYFVLLTAINIVNTIFFTIAPMQKQPAAASLGYVVTMIVGQRILIHLKGTFDP